MIQTMLITLSERIYRALLIFYSAEYRLKYGAFIYLIGISVAGSS